MVGNIYGIDFGTSTIKIYQKGAGLILDEKDIIAIEKVQNKKKVIAVGNEAFEMHGKAPSNITVSYHLRNGVIEELADMKEIIKILADNGNFFEVQSLYAQNIITGYIRLNGKTIGVVANQPKVLAGCLDING